MTHTDQIASPWDILQWMGTGGMDGHKYTAGDGLRKMVLPEDSPFVWVWSEESQSHWLAPAGKNGMPMVRCTRKRATLDWNNWGSGIPLLVGPRSPAYEARIGRPNLNPRPSFVWQKRGKVWRQLPFDDGISVRHGSWGIAINDCVRNAIMWHERVIALREPSPYTLLQSQMQLTTLHAITNGRNR